MSGDVALLAQEQLTPLHKTSQYGLTRVAEMLLDQGVPVDIEDRVRSFLRQGRTSARDWRKSDGWIGLASSPPSEVAAAEARCVSDRPRDVNWRAGINWRAAASFPPPAAAPARSWASLRCILLRRAANWTLCASLSAEEPTF